MTDLSHIDSLRQRVQQDPESIAFAQLAEELRRAGALQEAAEVCRRGLSRHPSYLSAHVTLGRALIQLRQLDEACASLELVHRAAPQNLAALRGLADIHAQREEYGAALPYCQEALRLAPNDPELERTFGILAQHLEGENLAKTSRARRTVGALEQWLAAIHVTRAQRLA